MTHHAQLHQILVIHVISLSLCRHKHKLISSWSLNSPHTLQDVRNTAHTLTHTAGVYVHVTWQQEVWSSAQLCWDVIRKLFVVVVRVVVVSTCKDRVDVMRSTSCVSAKMTPLPAESAECGGVLPGRSGCLNPSIGSSLCTASSGCRKVCLSSSSESTTP